jgi:hypothetical protein
VPVTPRNRTAKALAEQPKPAPRKRAAKKATPPPPPEPPKPVFESVLEETDRAITAAPHLGAMDAGAIAVARELAFTIDQMHDRPSTDIDGKALPLDNVTIPTYLRFCEQLGLTPAGRIKLGDPKTKVGGKLGQLRAIRGGDSDAASDAKPKRSSGRTTRHT